MQDLTPVGLDEEGTRLLLVSATGEEYAVRVDARLRAALRGEKARLGQVEMKMDSALRPRDIQARIRAGESLEEVAAAAQTSVESVMVFAGPVLAERAHVAQNALRASLRRPATESASPRTLGEAAERYFAEHSLHDEDVEWDSWRRPDGRWALVVAYAVAGRPRTAEFTHDLPGRYVVAENDEARLLTGELRRAEPPQAAAGTTGGTVRRLSSVHDQDELPLGDDAIELVRDDDTGSSGSSGAFGDPTAETADADWLAAPAVDHAEPDPVVPSPEDVPLISKSDTDSVAASDTESDTASGPGLDTEQEPIAGPTDRHPTDRHPTDRHPTDRHPTDRHPTDRGADEDDVEETEDTAEVERPAKSASSRRKGRSSVPSWDEIMFGGGGRED